MEVGKKIREIRKEKKLTQKELGKACGIDEANIRKYENGKQKPKVENLKKIADALDVPIQILLGLSQDQTHVIVEDDKFGFIYPNSENPEGNEDASQASSIPEIMKQYNKLNDAGKQKALEYTTDLAQMEKYQKEPEDKK